MILDWDSNSRFTRDRRSPVPRQGAKDLTAPVPVVGSVVEGVGNAPAVQKLGGKEEEKGYLGSIYDSAAGAVRTVYDAAGNVVGYFKWSRDVKS